MRLCDLVRRRCVRAWMCLMFGRIDPAPLRARLDMGCVLVCLCDLIRRRCTRAMRAWTYGASWYIFVT